MVDGALNTGAGNGIPYIGMGDEALRLKIGSGTLYTKRMVEPCILEINGIPYIDMGGGTLHIGTSKVAAIYWAGWWILTYLKWSWNLI